MIKALPNIEVVGGDDRIPMLTRKVGHGDKLKIGNIDVDVFFTPCHTTGHVLYVAGDGKSPKALFSGDTLFIGGCGRFFEGTAQNMYHALCEVVANLPKDTQVFCGHEYTVKNLQFAATIEKDNSALKKKLHWAEAQRNHSPPLPTIPSTVEEELSYNPFMRVDQVSIKTALGFSQDADPVDVMAKLRALKDKW